MTAVVVVAGVGRVGVEDTTVVVAQWAIPLASVPHGISPSLSVGSPVAQQSLDCCALVTPLYLCGAAQRGALPYMASTPDQGMDWIGFSISEIFQKEGDHIPNK
jgi:hypothetical protein